MAEDSPKSNIEYGGITSLAFDSGGSKLLCVRYDKNLIPVKSARTGSIRVHTNSEETSDERISEILAQVGLSAGDEIDLLCGAIDGAAIEKICGILKVRKVRFDGEMNLGLAAAVIDSDGILAVAGTGTSVFASASSARASVASGRSRRSLAHAARVAASAVWREPGNLRRSSAKASEAPA